MKHVANWLTQGFTLIELVVSIALGSLVILIVFQTLSVVQRGVSLCLSRSYVVTYQAAIDDIVYKDLSAIVTHLPPLIDKNADKKKDDKKEAESKGDKKPEAEDKKAQQPKEQKKDTRPLLVIVPDEKTQGTALLSCVTTSTIPVYGRVKKVPIRLIYQRGQKGELVRYESDDTTTEVRDFQTAKNFIESHKLVPFVLADEAASWSVEAIVFAEGAEKKRVSMRSWGTEKQASEKKSAGGQQIQTAKRRLPDMLIMRVEMSVDKMQHRIMAIALPIASEQEHAPLPTDQKSPPSQPADKNKKADGPGELSPERAATRESLMHKMEGML